MEWSACGAGHVTAHVRQHSTTARRWGRRWTECLLQILLDKVEVSLHPACPGWIQRILCTVVQCPVIH